MHFWKNLLYFSTKESKCLEWDEGKQFLWSTILYSNVALFIFLFVTVLWYNQFLIYLPQICVCVCVCIYIYIYIQTRFQKSWDTVQIVNKKGMQ